MTSTLRVLVVDDQESMRIYLSRVLNSIGYECEVAENGLICLEKCQEATYDVIFLDLVMPVMDGVHCLKELRANYPKTSVVIVSVEDDEYVVSQLLHSGATAYLCKPFETHMVQSLMQKLAEERETA